MAELHRRTAIHPWFLDQFAELVAAECDDGEGALARSKDLGFSDEQAGVTRAERLAAGLRPSFRSVDTCAAEFEAETPYFYSAYERRRPAATRATRSCGAGAPRAS